MVELVLILGERVREVWVDEHTRALVIPLETGKTVVSMDFYSRGWSFPIDEEVRVGSSTLIYYRPSSLSQEVSRLGVYKVEVIGHVTDDTKETISIRAWVEKADPTDREVIEIYKVLSQLCSTGSL